MELTTVAAWLNDTFYAFDEAVFRFMHTLATDAGTVLTPLANVVSYTAWKGAFLIVLALALLFLRKTRRTGLCACLALGVGVVLVNLLVKNLVARPRPYTLVEFQDWWRYVGAATEGDYCFPSGHVNAATAFVTALVGARGKKWLPVAVIYVLLMMFSRVYLIVHFATDVLGGLVFGLIAGLIACWITEVIYRRFGETRLLKQ